MPIDATNYARAALGQGLGMGWGDEAEAWLRSKLPGGGSYEQELANISKSYGAFAQKNPVTSAAAEFAGGALPLVASVLIPGGQAAAPAAATNTAGTLARLATNPYVRSALLGTTTGAVSGAGSAQPGSRGSGAATGALVGTVVGGGAPVVMRSGKVGYDWLRDRLMPSANVIESRAAGKVNRALGEAGITPQDAADIVAADRARGIPSTVANANPALVDLAETVAQRSGPSGRRVETKLSAQTAGSKERVYQQTRKALQPGEYYEALQDIQTAMRSKADPLYRQAYEFGEVTDPTVLSYLKLPQFKQGIKRAEKLLKAEGREIDLYKEVMDPTTGAKQKVFNPTVESLDQVKRGMDALIEKETDATTGKMSELGRVYVKKKNEFLDALDSAVPEYAQARAVYRGDAELMDAMRTGYNDFGKLDHEQVVKRMSKMSDAEKHAFKTGVSRYIYSQIMDPSQNINAARKIIGSPETAAKLRPLFESQSQFDLFNAAMEREAQLFAQSNRILGGAATGRRTQARERFEAGPGVGNVAADMITSGFGSSLMNLAARVARSATMTDDVADRVSQLLMSSDPAEVAAAVKALESFGKKAATSASRLSAAEGAVTTGLTISSQPAPPGPEGSQGELDSTVAPTSGGPDIEDAIRLEEKGNVPGPDLERIRGSAGPDIEEEIKKEK
jgi:hypothetical protein